MSCCLAPSCSHSITLLPHLINHSPASLVALLGASFAYRYRGTFSLYSYVCRNFCVWCQFFQGWILKFTWRNISKLQSVCAITRREWGNRHSGPICLCYHTVHHTLVLTNIGDNLFFHQVVFDISNFVASKLFVKMSTYRSQQFFNRWQFMIEREHKKLLHYQCSLMK